jgi:hypothetical protein
VSSYIEQHRDRFGVEPICRTLEVSASAYYERAKGNRSARAISDEHLLTRIEEIHKANYCAYGYRRTWIALRRAGEEVGRGRVQRLMRQAGIQGAKRRGKPWRTTTPDPAAERRPDLVERDFNATAPNRLWVGDFTYLRSWEGVSYFAFVIDAFSRRVVGWQLASHMRTDLVLDALRMALGQRDHGADFELVAHTDRGSQYTSADTPRSSTTPACWPPSARSATPTTTRWPRASSTPSRPSWSPTAPGALAPSSSWPSSNTSPGSTTSACTNPSATSLPLSSRTYTFDRRLN